MGKFKWLLDAGHGYSTPGKRSPKMKNGQQLMEFEYVRKIRDEIAKELGRLGLDYIFVTHYAEDVPLNIRANEVNKIQRTDKSAILISIHANAHGDGSKFTDPNGYEVFTSPGFTQSDIVAEFFYQAMADEGIFDMREDVEDGDHDREARFYMLTKTVGTSILTENGFYTNEEECKNMMKDSFVKKVAHAHVKAICAIEGISIKSGKVLAKTPSLDVSKFETNKEGMITMVKESVKASDAGNESKDEDANKES